MSNDLLDEVRRLTVNDKRLRSLVRWTLSRIVKSDHGCLTGGCPHEEGDKCIDAILSAWIEDVNTPPRDFPV
jgi:hypothetical protein